MNKLFHNIAMNIVIWERLADNFKIDIIYFVVNTNHTFAIYNSNVKMQKVIPFITYTAIQDQGVIISCDHAQILQIRCTYIIQIPVIVWKHLNQSILQFY